MKTQEVGEDLHRHGLPYVRAEVNRNAEEVHLEARDRRAIRVGKNLAREVIGGDGRQFIVLLNEERRQDELETLDHRIAQGRAILDELRRRFGKGPERHHHVILRQVHAALSTKGLGDLFEVEWDETTFQGPTPKLKETTSRRKQEAGWWVLSTDTGLPVEEVVRLYTGLSVIEAGRKDIKSVLEVRPVRHRVDWWVEAYLEICQLPYLLQQMLELRVKERVKVTGPRAVEMFHTVVSNEIEIAENGIRRQVVTELDSPQRAVVDAAGIDPTAFQKGWNRVDPG